MSNGLDFDYDQTVWWGYQQTTVLNLPPARKRKSEINDFTFTGFLFNLVYFPIQIDTIDMDLSILHIYRSQVKFFKF